MDAHSHIYIYNIKKQKTTKIMSTIHHLQDNNRIEHRNKEYLDKVQLLKECCDKANVMIDDIIKDDRRLQIHDKRVAIIHILHRHYSANAIGKLIHRHHSSILNALDQHDNLYRYDESYKVLYDDIINKL